MIYQPRDAFTLRGSLYVPASTPVEYDKSEHTFEITLRYAGKEYTITDTFAAPDPDWDALRLCTYLYEEGNYCCDCNRSNFLYQQHDVDFSRDPRREWDEGYEGGAWVLRCGNMIELVAIREKGMSEVEHLHALDNLLRCDVCKQGFFIFTRCRFLDEWVINMDCPHCYEFISTVHEVNFPAWCEQYHPELLEAYRPCSASH